MHASWGQLKRVELNRTAKFKPSDRRFNRGQERISSYTGKRNESISFRHSRKLRYSDSLSESQKLVALMVKGGKESEESTKPKPQIIEKRIGKKNGNGKKLEAVAMGVVSLSSAASGSDAPDNGISGSNDDFSGYIFLCNGRTKPECFSYRVFGLPALRIDVVSKIRQSTKLFLFDFDVKLLYGVYVATSTGTMNLEPHAFGGKFPAQVRFEIFKECMPIAESNFKHVIKENYQGRSKFRQDLSADQVGNLISLFRPLSSPPSAPRMSLLSNELQSRKILHQEIGKQSRSPGISTPVRLQAAGSQYIGSRFGHSSYQAPPVSLPLYDSERPLTSIDWTHEQPSAPSQYFPSSRYTKEPLFSGIQVNPRMGLPYDSHLYQNQDIGQSHGPAQIPQQISAPRQESDRAPSSVLAAAYWVAVANEIPQPGVHQTSDSAHNMAGQNSASLQYKPPNLTSASILDAYWEAKALEDSRQVHSGPSSHMLGLNAPNFSESAHVPSQSLSAPYWVSVASGDQNHLLHSNQQLIPSSSQGSASEAGNEVASFPPGSQQQVVYDPAQLQIQPSYYSTYL